MRHAPLAVAALLCVAGPLAAHHSFAPHFDINKPVDIAGVVTQFEQRNPHAYLHVTVQDVDGRSNEWRCESHGVTQLTRNGITPSMLKPGTVVRITGSQHRRDPHECFFNTVQTEDGMVYDVNGGGQRGTVPTATVAQRDSIYGIWLLQPAGRPTSGPQFMMDYTTDAAKAAIAQYNPFTDDPTYRCEPMAIRRGWFAPGTPMAIRQDGDDIIIQHEWMDIERRVHMNQDAVPEGTPAAQLGYSRGHWEGDTLVVETDHFTPGVLNQFVEVAGEPMRGLLHSDALRTVERIRFEPQRNTIQLAMEHYDPVFFTQDFPVVEGEFAASDLDIKPFG